MPKIGIRMGLKFAKKAVIRNKYKRQIKQYFQQIDFTARSKCSCVVLCKVRKKSELNIKTMTQCLDQLDKYLSSNNNRRIDN